MNSTHDHIPDPLFEPIPIRGMMLRNRICMPAMHLNMSTDFRVSPRILDFYRERAAGGVALITAGYATVDELSGNRTCIGAHSDDFISGLSELAATIQAEGARACLQLNHGGRYIHGALLRKGCRPVAPSPLASRLTRETPKALEPEEIRAVIEAFGQAARRTLEAGFDAVELLAGTGYLISQFLSPLTNQRQDEWGGSFDARSRFALEVLAAVRAGMRDELPVIVRMNGNELMRGGLGRRDLQRFAQRLEQGGAAALCVNVGWHEARVPQVVGAVPRAAFAYLAHGVKGSVDVPVIASHRINDPDLARSMLRDGLCDMVAMGRALLADPELPDKSRAGREKEVVHCVACGQGCFDRVFRLRPVECLCNPRAGYESQRSLEPAAQPRRVMVVGGGPAGLSAAAAAAARGHRVELFESSEQTGGQLRLAGRPPGREDFLQLARDLVQQARRHGVHLHTGQTVDASVLDQHHPDAVIVATGARPLLPADIPGLDRPQVVQAWDVLSGKAVPGKRVAVVGGGAVGVETALHLAEQGSLTPEVLEFLLVNEAEPLEDLRDLASRGSRQVMVVELLAKLGQDLGRSIRWVLLRELVQRGVQSRTATRLLEVTEEGIRVQDGDGREAQLLADTVVLALGARSHHPLQDTLAERSCEVRVVGDALRVGNAMDAIHQGFLAGAAV